MKIGYKISIKAYYTSKKNEESINVVDETPPPSDTKKFLVNIKGKPVLFKLFQTNIIL